MPNLRAPHRGSALCLGIPCRAGTRGRVPPPKLLGCSRGLAVFTKSDPPTGCQDCAGSGPRVPRKPPSPTRQLAARIGAGSAKTKSDVPTGWQPGRPVSGGRPPYREPPPKFRAGDFHQVPPANWLAARAPLGLTPDLRGASRPEGFSHPLNLPKSAAANWLPASPIFPSPGSPEGPPPGGVARRPLPQVPRPPAPRRLRSQDPL